MEKLKKLLFCAVFPLIFARPLSAIGFDPGNYGSLADRLGDLYDLQGNAGLTAFPVLNIPLGGKAEGMAGSFSAVADDVSFLEWNPAGSSMLSKTELGFFHHSWIADARIEGAAFASRFKNFGFAAGGKWLYAPFAEYNTRGERVSKGYYSEAVAILNGSFNLFSGGYFPGVSLGANLKGAFRFVPDFSDSGAQDRRSGSLVPGAGWEQSAATAMADLGVLARTNLWKFYHSRERNFSFALVLRNLGPPVKGDSLPAVAVAGVSWKPWEPVLLSFDYSFPMNLTDINLSEKPYWAAGLSVQANDFLSLRSGLLFKGENARIVLGGAVDLKAFSLDLNYTLDLLPQLIPLNRIGLGIRFNLGDQGRADREAEAEALYLQGLEAYARGELEAARHYWEETLKADPRFEPAAEGLSLIARSQALMERIDEMQSLGF
jgi:hypothetical protein